MMTPLGIDIYKGFTIERGAYVGTTHDRIDRWYITPPTGPSFILHTGPGYATRQDARDALEGLRMRQGDLT